MSKRSIIFLGIIAVAIISFVMLSYYFVEEQKSYVNIPPIHAVPQNAPLFIESRDFSGLLKSLLTDNKIWSDLVHIETIANINRSAKLLDSLFKADEDISDILDEKSVIISTHITGKNNIEFLYIVNIFSLSDEEKTMEYIDNKFNSNQLSKRSYDNIVVHRAKIGTEGQTFDYTVANGFLLMSLSPLLIEQSIRQLNSGNSLLTDQHLKEISQTAGKNVQANIYINYKTFPSLISILLNNNYSEIVGSFSPFANWGEFDLNIKSDLIMLNGFTNSVEVPENYLSVFKDIKPVASSIHKIIPSSISAYLALSFDDAEQFYSNYREHLRSNNKLEQHNTAIEELNKESGTNLENLFLSFMSTDMAIVFEDINRADFNQGNFIVIGTTGSNNVRKQLLNTLQFYAKQNKRFVQEFITTITVNGDEYLIYQIPFKNLPQRLFGSTFSKSHPNYFTFIDDYLIFGSSVNNLSNYLTNVKNDKNLDNDKEYLEFAGYTESEFNYFFYLNVSRSVSMISSHITEELNTSLEKNISTIGKFQALAFQLKTENNMLYSNALLKYSPSNRTTSSAMWQTRLDTTINFKPFFFTNHYTMEKEIFVQDEKNKIYLISNTGRVLWEKQINERIISTVHEVDIFRNNKLQLMFATRNGIHLIDRLGNYVENYPKKFSEPASNSVSIFDYDKTGEYRFIFASNDFGVHAYNALGEKIEGWIVPKAAAPIVTTIQYFNLLGKDYLVFADKNRPYFVNRKGVNILNAEKTPSIATDATIGLDINHKGRAGKQRFVIPAESGELIYVYTDGKVETKRYTDTQPKFFFEYSDINNDGFLDPIFLNSNKLQVFKHDGSPLFSFGFSNSPHNPPFVYTFSAADRRIGVVDKQLGQIYLLRNNGELYQKFPMDGNSPFSVGVLNPLLGKFNLIVGNDEGFLLNYEME